MSEKRHTYSAVLRKGLDLSSGPFEASPERALDEMNYAYIDGRVRKRPGYKNVLDIPASRYFRRSFDGETASALSTNSSPKVNGIWEFRAEDGKTHVVCHAGKLLYEITSTGNEAWDCEPISKGYQEANGSRAPMCYEFEDYKSSAFVGARMLWFLGGNSYMRLRWPADGSGPVLEPVAESDFAYVPVTTASIAYEEAKAGQREQIDATNLMTRWRRNLLISGIGKSSDGDKVEKTYRYVLDAPLITKDRAKDMAAFHITLTERRDGE